MMLELKDLTNDNKRKQFFENYDENWPLIHTDDFIGFKIYRFDFEDGSMLTALQYNDSPEISGPYKAVITLTKEGQIYRPIASTQGEIVNHLKEFGR